MKRFGLLRSSLLDYPGRIACTLFAVGCNFRCPFCHNASLVVDSEGAGEFSEEEIFSFLKKRRSVLDGVCISGGEPLLHEDLPALIEKIRALGYLVKLDTNGSFSEPLRWLVTHRMIDYVAMDIKNSLENYGKTIGIPVYDPGEIEKSVGILKKNLLPFEFRTTVVREFHTEEDFISIMKFLAGAPRYYLQNFVDSPHNIQAGLHGYTREGLVHIQKRIEKNFGVVELRGI
jgi:pyruvate formate lyase activating enzyme